MALAMLQGQKVQDSWNIALEPSLNGINGKFRPINFKLKMDNN